MNNHNQTSAKYAIPCAFGFKAVFDQSEVFFLTFNTTDEKQAYRLARCVCGENAESALIIVNEEGEIFQL